MGEANPVQRVVEVAKGVVLRVLPGGAERGEGDSPRIPAPVTPPPRLRAVGEKVRDAAASVSDRITGDEAESPPVRRAEQPADEQQGPPGSGKPYEQWTKAELYERAQELDIEGRSKMTKDELVAALRDA